MPGLVGSQVMNPLEEATAWRGQFGYRFHRPSSTAVGLLEMGPVGSAGGIVYPPGAAPGFTVTDELMDSNGDPSGEDILNDRPNSPVHAYAFPPGGTDYPDGFALSLTPPTFVSAEGLWRLPANPRSLFVGWAQCVAGAFVDTPARRLVASYFWRRARRMLACPNYADADSDTTYTFNTTATWAAINGGTGDFLEWCDFADGDVPIYAQLQVGATFASDVSVAIGVDGATDVRASATIPSALTRNGTTVSVWEVHQRSGFGFSTKTAQLLAKAPSANATIKADEARNGADADVPTTYIAGWVWQ